MSTQNMDCPACGLSLKCLKCAKSVMLEPFKFLLKDGSPVTLYGEEKDLDELGKLLNRFTKMQSQLQK